MSSQHPPRPPTRRGPLSDATARVNNAQQPLPVSQSKQRPSHHRELELENQNPAHGRLHNKSIPYLLTVTEEEKVHNSNRDSQASAASTNVSDSRKRKIHIGPWHLGKTLGKGSTARVRMARHVVTGQLAAIKIVQKKNAQLSQAGSLAALDRKEAMTANHGDGFRKMPYGIEREVAIMKLIEHPHIMKLYDIWENRTEIYLVLEYVDNGELFEHISRRGCLPEKEALKFFRQILSAVGYCHSFNICHRDLKPENILLTKNLTVKIADFGMAALHQTPEHRLQTSCGSPHYAAPEVIRASYYRGDKADIWSLGVILFASLAGYLPFDHDSIPCLLELIKSGRYSMASSFSAEATDLIRRMLLVNPRDRLTINQIWKHPLLRKYDYIDDYGVGDYPKSMALGARERPLLRRSDIDKELLRHLRSLWHTFEEQQLIDLLLDDEPNDQKRFYNLLLKHQEAQLENYVPDVFHSTSDYHHVRPLAQTRRLSTRQFSQPNPKSHRRQISRFTVVSNVGKNGDGGRNSSYAETDAAETVRSYDPFKASQYQNFSLPQGVAYSNVTIHRKRPSSNDIKITPQKLGLNKDSAGRCGRNQNLVLPARVLASRSSLASSGRSPGSGSGRRVPKLNKRNVSFNHLRKPSGPSQHSSKVDLDPRAEEVQSEYTEITDDGGDALCPIADRENIHSCQREVLRSSPRPSPLARTGHTKSPLGEDLGHLSSSLGKVCDEAFNRNLVSPIPTKTIKREANTGHLYDSSLSEVEQNRSTPPRPSSLLVPKQIKGQRSWDTRPLPPPPARSESIKVELNKAREEAELRKYSGEDSPDYIDRLVSHIDQLLQPNLSPVRQGGERRTASAPVAFRSHDVGRPLPSIYESNGEYASPIRPIRSRNISNNNGYGFEDGVLDGVLRHKNRAKERTRAMPQYSPPPAQPPAPLNIRKKISRGPQPTNGDKLGTNSGPPAFDLRQQYIADQVRRGLPTVDEFHRTQDPFEDVGLSNVLKKKKTNWFNRSSKSDVSEKDDSNMANVDPFNLLNKKKSFGFGRLFKRNNPKKNVELGSSTFEIYDDSGSIADSIDDPRRAAVGNNASDDPRTRQIEPHQNWLARLFRVKPATGFICFSVSRRRARQEIVHLLKEWRKYGARDVVVDKDRNIVFARVGSKNYFNMKEVSFAIELMTVIEHGKRSHLSIARLTQERGAASSFYQVVETLQRVMKSRGMLFSDERKKRMMIQTLQS